MLYNTVLYVNYVSAKLEHLLPQLPKITKVQFKSCFVQWRSVEKKKNSTGKIRRSLGLNCRKQIVFEYGNLYLLHCWQEDT